MLGAGAFIAKLLGAIYRIPLTNLLGGEGLGLYQLIFPVYCVLLDFAGAGVPSALSKIISSSNGDKIYNARDVLNVSVRALSVVGVIFTALMMALAMPLSKLQGNENAYLGYIFLSPSVFLVAIISCYRGYFQGLMNMKPTAISQITEQVIKLAFGLLLCVIFLPNVPLAVGGATLAVTISELSALIVLVIIYKKHKTKQTINYVYDRTKFRSRLKKVIAYTIPVTLIGIAIPLSQVIDSFLIINILKTYRSDATSLYGLLSGTVTTVINVPVAVCYGVATVAIPAVSGSKTEEERRRNVKKTTFITLAFSLPCAIFCAMCSPFVVKLLFGGLGENERIITQNLLRLTSVNIVLLSVVQTNNAVLIGKGKPYYPLISMGIGIAVKTVLNVILLRVPQINIYGGGIAVIACYFTTCLVNLIISKKMRVKNANQRSCRREYAS